MKNILKIKYNTRPVQVFILTRAQRQDGHNIRDRWTHVRNINSSESEGEQIKIH